MSYVIHKEKNTIYTIFPPYIEEVLDKDFDYPAYIQKEINQIYDKEFLEDWFDFTPEKPIKQVDHELAKLWDDYENAIIALQKAYEDDLENGSFSMDYNAEMKKVAQEYQEKLENMQKLKLQKENEFKALTAKRTELVSALSQMLEVKRNIEENSDKRLNDFVQRKIPLGKLYIYDLTHLKKGKPYSEHLKRLYYYRRHVLASMLNDEGAYYKQIKDLNFQRKQK